MDFSNFMFDVSASPGSMDCTDITILDDDIFEKFQVIELVLGESDPVGLMSDASFTIVIVDDGESGLCACLTSNHGDFIVHAELNDTFITVLNTSVELEEAKRQLNICAQLNVSEVQAKTVARFAVLVDDSLLGKFISNCVTSQ